MAFSKRQAARNYLTECGLMVDGEIREDAWELIAECEEYQQYVRDLASGSTLKTIVDSLLFGANELMRIVKECISSLLHKISAVKKAQMATSLSAEMHLLREQLAAQMPKNSSVFLREYKACILKRLGITDLIELFSDEECDDVEPEEDFASDAEPIEESEIDLGDSYDAAFTDSVCAINNIHPVFVGAYCSDGCSEKQRLARALKLNSAFAIVQEMMSICDFNRIAFAMFESDRETFDSATPEVLACMCTYKRRMEILQAAKH